MHPSTDPFRHAARHVITTSHSMIVKTSRSSLRLHHTAPSPALLPGLHLLRRLPEWEKWKLRLQRLKTAKESVLACVRHGLCIPTPTKKTWYVVDHAAALEPWMHPSTDPFRHAARDVRLVQYDRQDLKVWPASTSHGSNSSTASQTASSAAHPKLLDAHLSSPPSAAISPIPTSG